MAQGTTPPPIDAEMVVAAIVSRFPETIAVFSRHGVACVGCCAAGEDTVAQAAQTHGLDCTQLLEELNGCLRRSSP